MHSNGDTNSDDDDSDIMAAVNTFEDALKKKNLTSEKEPLNPVPNTHNDESDNDDDDDILKAVNSFENTTREKKMATELDHLKDMPSANKPKANEKDDNDCGANQKYISVLKHYFGYSKFRPMQLKIIKSVVEDKRDNLVIMATGRGKSLCYQFPALYLNGLCIVYSQPYFWSTEYFSVTQTFVWRTGIAWFGTVHSVHFYDSMTVKGVRPLKSTSRQIVWDFIVPFLTDKNHMGYEFPLWSWQLYALLMVNVEACFLGTAQDDQDLILDGIRNEKYRVVYITPEYIENNFQVFEELNNRNRISLVAIDECHCVSQWGNDFRSSYRKLGTLLRDKLKNVPFMALTATATKNIRDDIVKSLHLRSPVITVTSFDRPNLNLSVSLKTESILNDLRSLMAQNKKFNGATIIYCQTKKLTGQIKDLLVNFGIKCDCYHADLKMSERKAIQKKFLADEIDVIIATVAFGMGIDKPDIRNVIHYGAPKDLESYYQEIGRAGRDGLPSECHVFYKSADFQLARFFFKDLKNETFRDHKNEMLNKMQTFLTTNSCRRRFLLQHFDDNEPLLKSSDVHDACCDRCSAKLDKLKARSNDDAMEFQKNLTDYVDDDLKDYTDEAKKLFRVMRLLMPNTYGMKTYAYYLTGSNSLTKKINSNHLKNELFNSASVKSVDWWKSFTQQLINEGYITTKSIPGSFGSTLEMKPHAEDLLKRTDKKVMIIETNEMKQKTSSALGIQLAYDKVTLPMVPTNSISYERQTFDTAEEETKASDLYTILIGLRNELASEFGLSTHKIASNKVLTNLTKVRPSDVKFFENMEDFADAKMNTIGNRFIQKIKQFCLNNDLKMDNFGSSNSTGQSSKMQTKNDLDPKLCVLLEQLPVTKREAYILFEYNRKSISEVALNKSIATSTVLNYLVDCVSIGLPLDYARLNVTDQMISHVEEKLRLPPINSDISRLAPIKEVVNNDISWDSLKLVIALLKRKYGFNTKSFDSSDKRQAMIQLNENFAFSPAQNKFATKSNQKPERQAEENSRPLPTWFKRKTENDVNEAERPGTELNDHKIKKKKLDL